MKRDASNHLADQARQYWDRPYLGLVSYFIGGNKALYFFWRVLRRVIFILLPRKYWSLLMVAPMNSHGDVHEADGRFAKSCRVYKNKIPHLFNLANKKLDSLKVLEWGPGGGALLKALGGHFIEVCGVDIARVSLKVAAKTAKRHQVNFQPVLYDPAKDIPEQIRRALPQKGDFDLFSAHAVYQHFPNKAMGKIVTELAFDYLKPGGVAMINFNSEDLACAKNVAHLRNEANPNYSKFFGRATVWRLDEFKKMVEDCGFKVLEFEKADLDGGSYKSGEDFYYYVYLQKP